MATERSFEGITRTSQVVLLGVVELHRDDETPVQTHEVRRACRSRLEHVRTDVVGTITEADVMRSLYRLEDDGLVEEVDVEGASPTGKGRPAYTLEVDPETITRIVDDDLVSDSD